MEVNFVSMLNQIITNVTDTGIVDTATVVDTDINKNLILIYILKRGAKLAPLFFAFYSTNFSINFSIH